MEELRLMARRLIEEEEVNVIILSDRGVNREFAPIPALLAVAGLHHYLIREGLRTRVSLVLETGDAREVHHFALLIGYGVQRDQSLARVRDARRMIDDGLLTGVDHKPPARTSSRPPSKGVIKVMSKMGISLAPELPRRADLRGRRAAPGRHRRVFQLDRLARRRHRHRT